ncbi:carboxymuconolactone decarboxylase family protein [Limnoglobus roseus]|uniref:Carboxymuconolactone decarboxylase family protein n=1 Tax=Limnoglobus roseus TaxID=2598579 RepID=A0A5C1AQD2_9BACT|nr:carboxymuconolactone decarboxylase family protein [Limnoglobus roseus]QEL20263.1 carboxymuconolactone decarboxylase family protein [Limnoglobus roseus]
MTWIKTIPYDQGDEELKRTYEAVRALYPEEYGGPPVPSLLRSDGTADSIVAAHSLIPEAMRHMMSGLAVLLRPGLGLTRRQQEMIASVVSVRNGCFY